MYKNKPSHEDIQFNIGQCVSSSSNNNLYPLLKLYKGMRVMCHLKERGIFFSSVHIPIVGHT
jgi:hypothetical protein